MLVRIGSGVLLLFLLAPTSRAQDCNSMFSQSMAVMQGDAINVYYQMRKPVYMDEQRPETYFETITESITQTVDGKPVTKNVDKQVAREKTVTVKVCKFVCEMRARKLDVNNSEAFDATGKPIAWEELPKLLAKPTLVVVTANGKPLPPALAAALKPTTIVLATVPEIIAAPPVGPQPILPPQPVAPIAPADGVINGTAPAVLPIAPPERRTPPPPAEPPPARRAERIFRPAVYQVPAPAIAKPVADAPAIAPAANSDLPQMSTAAPPSLQLASLSINGNINVKSLSSIDTTAYIVVTAGDPDSPEKLQTVPVTQQRDSSVTTTYPLDFVSAVTVDGREVPPEILKRYLKSERAVLIAADATEVDKFWLQNMKPTTVILTVPAVKQHEPAIEGAVPTPLPSTPPVAPPPPIRSE